MKIIAKNCSLVFQTAVQPEPEAVTMVVKSATRIQTNPISKDDFKDFTYYTSDNSNYEIIVGVSDSADMSGESYAVDWKDSISWSDLSAEAQSRNYFRIVCRRKDQGNLSPSDVTLYKIAE